MGRLVPVLVAFCVLACAGTDGARLYASGNRALDRGDVDAAIHDFELAAERLPEASEVHNHLGVAYARAGRTEGARRAFDRALELDCDNAAAQHNKARLARGAPETSHE